MTTDDKPTGYNGHAYFTIDDIAAMLPSPARLMPEVGARWWKAYYAAKEGNWPLAEFQVKEIEELIDTCMITRPKYAQWMEPFIKDDLGGVKKAIKAGDWDQFEELFNESTKNANDYHKAADKPLLQWRLPEYPPPDLDLSPLPDA